jgi:hypothetical protein
MLTDYNEMIEMYNQRIALLKHELSEYKTAYLDKLYRNFDSPETVVNRWLQNIWPYCQSGGDGHSFKVYRFDYDLQPSDMVSSAVSRVHYLGCDCHSWPACWNVKTKHYIKVSQACTEKITDAFLSLGYKIRLSPHSVIHEWTD